MRKIPSLAKASVLTAFVLSAPVGAQNFPEKAVRVVVTSSPGGATDIQARLFAGKLSEILNQPFVVENRVGAGGRIASGYVAHQAPRDGYTVLATSPGFTIVPAVDAKPPIDPVQDFEPIILMSKAPYALVVNPKFPADNMKEFLAWTKANPGKLIFALSNIRSTTHFAQVWLADAANIKMTTIPYKGTGPATQDLIAGRVHASFANVISAGPHIKAGRIRALAVTTAERSSGLPDLPTFAESGLEDYEVTTWHGWLGPKGMPAPAVKALNAGLNQVLKSPEVIKVIATDGGMPVGGTSQAFAKHISSEIARWKHLVKVAGIKPK